MTKKTFLRKILRFLLFLLGISLYLGFYLFPAIKSINKIKREVRETHVRINDLVKMEGRFIFSDEKEETYFKKSDATLMDRFPIIRDHRDLIHLVDKYSDYIQRTGNADGVRNLVIMSASKEMMVRKLLLVSDEISSRQLLDFTTSTLYADSGEPEVLATFLEQLKYQSINLGFSGNIQALLNFLNHIPWYENYIGGKNVTISKGDNFPLVVVSVKMYYIDKRTKVPRQLPKKPIPEQDEFMVDFHSEVLLNQVYLNLPIPYLKRDIPNFFGDNFFQNGKRK